MLRFLADYNFSEIIITQVLAALPDLDLVRARDIGMAQTPDSDIFGMGSQLRAHRANSRHKDYGVGGVGPSSRRASNAGSPGGNIGNSVPYSQK